MNEIQIRRINVPESEIKLHVDEPSVVPETKQYTVENGQKLGGTVIDRRKKDNDPTFIVAMGFAAATDNDFEIQKYSVLTESLGDARLLVIDTPGFGKNASRLKGLQFTDPLWGEYNSWAKSMIQAAIQAGDLSEGEKIGVIGYSNGALLADFIGAELNKHHAEYKKLKIAYGIHHLEPTGDHTQIPFELKDTMKNYENNFNRKYFRENRELGTWIEEDKAREGDTLRSQISLGLAGVALGGGARPFFDKYILKPLLKPFGINGAYDEFNAGGGMMGEALRAALKGSEKTTGLNESMITSTLSSESHMTSIERQEKMLISLKKVGFNATKNAAIILRESDTHAFPLSWQRLASAGKTISELTK